MKRLRASTLIETVISMGLLGSVLAVSGVIYSNVLRSDPSIARTRMALAIAHWSMVVDPLALPPDQRITWDGVDLSITAREEEGMTHVHFTATIEGRSDSWECDRILVP